MKKKLTVFIFSMILLFFCLSYNKTPQITPQILPVDTSGIITYGLYNLDGEIETNWNFHINSGSKFERIFSFGNYIEHERKYRLLIFANYKQLYFSVNNKNYRNFYDFIADPNSHTQCKITLPPLEDGFYDLLFVIVKDPDNINLNEDYRKQTDLSHLSVMRYSLQVGTKESHKVMPQVLNAENNHVLHGVFLNQNVNQLQRLLTLNCSAYEYPELYIHVGNTSDTPSNYAFLLLYDWNQMQINSQDFYYISVPAESRVVLPFKLESTSVNGVHNLTVVCVEEPFTPVSLNSPNADFSLRVGVNIN